MEILDTNTDTHSEAELALIAEEEFALGKVMESLKAQLEVTFRRLSNESTRARELTSGLVAARRVEDKVQLASDEAVSHGLVDKAVEERRNLEQLLQRPYFGRIVLAEEQGEQIVEREYKVGFIENTVCRIIDWRKSPLAQFFYQYQEGDEYCEEIQGRERNGIIKLRTTLEIIDGALKSITCRYGTFQCTDGSWHKSAGAARSRRREAAPDARPNQFHLPEIAALLSPEQFRLIADNRSSSLFIQGIAGSGKTTIALHRLAMLLSQPDYLEQGRLQSEECAVIVLSEALKSYLAETLVALGIQNLQALGLREWLGRTLLNALPLDFVCEGRIRRPEESCPRSIERLKRSMAMLRALEHLAVNSRAPALLDSLKTLFDRPQLIIENDETKLIDQEVVRLSRERTIANLARGVLDECDDALLLRLHELQSARLETSEKDSYRYRHIVCDEVQDFSPVDLACVMGALKDTRGLTLVGDTAQALDQGTLFPGWDKLRRYWDFRDSISTFVSLNMSHRSTQQILNLAGYVRDGSSLGQSAVSPAGRSGRIPIWFHGASENQALKAAINWLRTALDKYPVSLSVALARDQNQARTLYRLLMPTFGEALSLVDERSFAMQSGLCVAPIELVKGLEFVNVLIWNPTKNNFPADTFNRNLLYTALTRAEENVCLVTWHGSNQGSNLAVSALLPATRSPLLRYFAV